jgi:hypothetical protein
VWIRVVCTSDAESATFRIFSDNFERSFRRVFWYVSRRVNDQEILERIVSDVLEENLDILVIQGDAPREADRLRVSANRLIAQVKGSEQPDAATQSQRPKFPVETELRERTNHLFPVRFRKLARRFLS